jgi:hypothetical protein
MKERFMIVSYVLTRNGTYDELTDFKNRVSPTNLAQASVILDLRDKLVVKNSLHRNYNFYEVLSVFVNEIGAQLYPYIEHLAIELSADVIESETVDA